MATVATQMKKLLNDPANIVKESLAGLAAAHGDLVRYDAEAQILVRATPADKVALISGGGTGASWDPACWTPRALARSSPRRCRSRCSRPRRRWTPARASSTSSRTTP